MFGEECWIDVKNQSVNRIKIMEVGVFQFVISGMIL